MIGLKLISWHACNKNGELVTGLLVAKNKAQIKQMLLKRALIPVKIHYRYFYPHQFSRKALPDFFFSNLGCYSQTV